MLRKMIFCLLNLIFVASMHFSLAQGAEIYIEIEKWTKRYKTMNSSEVQRLVRLDSLAKNELCDRWQKGSFLGWSSRDIDEIFPDYASKWKSYSSKELCLLVCLYHHCRDLKLQDRDLYIYLVNKPIDPIYQYLLGSLYACGLGVHKDPNRALYWYYRAAEQGYALAQNSLGYQFVYGNGVDQNISQAIFWYQKAAEQGYKLAQQNLQYIYHSVQIGFKKDLELPIYCSQRAAEEGCFVKEEEYGEYYLRPYYLSSREESVPVNINNAIFFFLESAYLGDTAAQRNLGIVCEHGHEHDKAFLLYKKVAKLGDEIGQLYSGMIYEEGTRNPKNMMKAIFWYQRAATQGNEEARKKIELLSSSAVLQTRIEHALKQEKSDKKYVQSILVNHSGSSGPSLPNLIEKFEALEKPFLEIVIGRESILRSSHISLENQFSFLNMPNMQKTAQKIALFWGAMRYFVMSLESPGSFLGWLAFGEVLNDIYSENLCYHTTRRNYFTIFPQQIKFLKKLKRRIKILKDDYKRFQKEEVTWNSMVQVCERNLNTSQGLSLASTHQAIRKFFEPYDDYIVNHLKVLQSLENDILDYIDKGDRKRADVFLAALNIKRDSIRVSLPDFSK